MSDKGKRVGYVRVSTLDQNTQRQLDGIILDKVFTDHASGKDTARPELQAALEYLREGDTFVIHSMDRLARNIGDLLRVVDDLTKRGVVVEFQKEHLIFTGEDSPMSKLMLTVMGGVADFERSLIRERQREGIQLAKQAGKYKGRKPVLGEEDYQAILGKIRSGISKTRIAEDMGISRETIYAYLRARGKTGEV